MVSTKIHTGLVIFWSLAEFTDRYRLKGAWSAAGLEKFMPERRANVSVLKDALTEVFAKSRFLVRPLSSRNGFAVVREERGLDENNYAAVLTAKVFGEDTNPVYSGNVVNSDEVNTAYHKHGGRLTSNQVSSALVRVLYELGGTRLRPSGSIYWLPGHQADDWARVVAGFEEAADGGKSVGYSINHELDSDSIVAVRDAITNEVAYEAARLSKEILSEDIGPRAIESRRKEAVLLKKKVAEYEEILGVGLANLLEVLERVDQTTATAALLLATDFSDAKEEVPNGITA